MSEQPCTICNLLKSAGLFTIGVLVGIFIGFYFAFPG